MNIHDILLKHWGYSSFRPLQEDIIHSVLSGKDTLALLPTGGGKSICFQVPAMMSDGMCLVISPLIALMKDQVQNLKKKGIEAFALYSGLKWTEMELIYNHCNNNSVKFLYISPERLENKEFIERLKQWKVNLLAVDEAHCISQWGYDFRPPYLRISQIRKYLTKIPVLALTATAVPAVVEDIQSRLGFPQVNVFQKSFHRDNLAYIVIREEDKKGRLLKIISRTKGTGIVYVRNRKKTAEIAQFLVKNGISAGFYHAGLEAGIRSKRQDDWMNGTARVMVATNAFGMGIDKPDVRFVVHLDLPESLEAYFQEAGRAGRDEKSSYSVILYDESDITNLKSFYTLSWPETEKIRSVYLALANYARIPSGAGSGTSLDFDIYDFSQQYRFNPSTVFKIITFLEKEGYLLLQDEGTTGSVVHFKAERQELYQIQVSHPQLDEMIKVLLRSYGGMFTDFVPVRESDIASRCGIEKNAVVDYLNLLQRLNVLDYIPAPVMPQLVFCHDRIDEKHIAVNKENYLQQKATALGRLQSVIDYVKLENHCRNNLLLSYFGERATAACGKCDVCLKNKVNRPSEKDFNLISKAIETRLNDTSMPLSAMFSFLKTYPEPVVMKVISWMIENEQLVIDKNKNLSLPG
ncbi:MAG: ATP-dependent DNA helicase RecQ [Bacteroidales bacterium]